MVLLARDCMNGKYETKSSVEIRAESSKENLFSLEKNRNKKKFLERDLKRPPRDLFRYNYLSDKKGRNSIFMDYLHFIF